MFGISRFSLISDRLQLNLYTPGRHHNPDTLGTQRHLSLLTAVLGRAVLAAPVAILLGMALFSALSASAAAGPTDSLSALSAPAAPAAPAAPSVACNPFGFGSANQFGVGIQPQTVAVGDFNRDGNPDFATANSGSANVSVLLGNGTGGFGAATNFAV